MPAPVPAPDGPVPDRSTVPGAPPQPAPPSAAAPAERFDTHHGPLRLIFPLTVAIALIVLLAAVGHGLMERAREKADFLADAGTDARALAAHARQTMTAADLVLRSVTDQVNAAQVSTVAELRQVLGTQAVHEMLKDRQKGVPQVSVASIVDLQGDMVNFTRNYPPRSAQGQPINLKERDYFRAHLEDPKLELFLSRPVPNKGTGTMTFYLARKIRGVHGEMLGVVLAGLESEYFQDFYEAISLQGRTAMLRLADGPLLARWPADPAALGRVEPAAPQRASGGWMDFIAAPASVEATATVPEFPLVVAVQLSDDFLLSAWHRSVISTALLAVSLASAVIGLGLLARRHVSEVGRAMQDLGEARERAEIATRAKSDFIATMSHEIRTPMNAVVGLVSLLETTPLDRHQRSMVQVIAESSDTLLGVVNDVLDLSRLESTAQTLEERDFELRALVDEVVSIARGFDGSERLALKSSVDPELPVWLRGDRAKLSRLLLNLLHNAVKYTPQGEVALRVGAMGDQHIAWSVADTGVGVPPDMVERIFEPFEQGRRSDRLAPRKGTGLGLAIGRRLARVMGGTLNVDTQEGKGSTFILRTPLKLGAPRAAVTPVAVSPRQGLSGLRVLVAEDTPASQLVIRLALERIGCVVQVVGDGAEAVRAYLREPFDLVLLDIQMPIMDGYRAARALRAIQDDHAQSTPERPPAPVVALSAFAQPEDRQEALQSGMSGYLTKPVKAAELERLIADLGIARPVAAKPAPPQDGGGIDQEMLAQLREDLGEIGFGTALDAFERNARATLETLADNGAGLDNDAALRAVHRLKGLLLQFGAADASRSAGHAEVELRAGRRPDLAPVRRAAESALGRILDQASPDRAAR